MTLVATGKGRLKDNVKGNLQRNVISNNLDNKHNSTALGLGAELTT